jgi:hypothetical protein
MPKVDQERFELTHAEFGVGDVGVNLEPVAGREHRRFADRIVIVQRDQRFRHPLGWKGMPFANLRGCLAV